MNLKPEGFNMTKENVLEKVLIRPMLVGFYPTGLVQLVTNVDSLDNLERTFETDIPAFVRTANYLRAVKEGDGKPYCPFVELIERNNDYFIINIGKDFEPIKFEKVIDILEYEFRALSPRETYTSQPVDTTTVVAAFSEPNAMSQDFCHGLDEVRNHFRQRFLDQGLMIAQMQPYHPFGGVSKRKSNGPLYVSEIPLLMVRRMHQPDHVFMKLPQEKIAYSRYFGDVQ